MSSSLRRVQESYFSIESIRKTGVTLPVAMRMDGRHVRSSYLQLLQGHHDSDHCGVLVSIFPYSPAPMAAFEFCVYSVSFWGLKAARKSNAHLTLGAKDQMIRTITDVAYMGWLTSISLFPFRSKEQCRLPEKLLPAVA